jgi:hypothetical protein
MQALSRLICPALIACSVVHASAPIALPKDVPPVNGTALAANDSETWGVRIRVPKTTWEVIGERRPKTEWPELQVKVEELVLRLSMDYHPATALSEVSQHRIVDLNGRRLERAEALLRLKQETPVLISVSGRMPDSFYLQCVKADTLVVILGIPDCPAPDLLPHPLHAATSPATTDDGRTKR